MATSSMVYKGFYLRAGIWAKDKPRLLVLVYRGKNDKDPVHTSWTIRGAKKWIDSSRG